MKSKPVFWLAVLIFVAACELPGFVPPASPPTQVEPTRRTESQPEPTPSCISSQPTQEDVGRALEFTGKAFERDDWTRSHAEEEYKVSVTWHSDSLSAVAFLEALIFPCGYEEPDLDAYFEENWDIYFENYEDYEPAAECRNNSGLRLYEFQAVSGGGDYDVRYWVYNDTSARVISLMLVMPSESADVMDEYAYALFPRLAGCP